MIIADLNGIEFSESELNRYEEIGNISEDKIERLNENIKTTLAKTNLKEIHNKIKSMLDEEELVEDVIEGVDIDKMSYYAIVPFYEYALNKIVFITDRRVIIVNVTTSNIQFKIKEYKKSDIKSIECGNKRTKMSRIEKLTMRIAYLLGFITFIFIIPVGVLTKLILYIVYMISVYKIIRTIFNKAQTIVIRFNDGYLFEIVPKNNVDKDLEKRILKMNNI